MERSKLKATSV